MIVRSKKNKEENREREREVKNDERIRRGLCVGIGGRKYDLL